MEVQELCVHGRACLSLMHAQRAATICMSVMCFAVLCTFPRCEVDVVGQCGWQLVASDGCCNHLHACAVLCCAMQVPARCQVDIVGQCDWQPVAGHGLCVHRWWHHPPLTNLQPARHQRQLRPVDPVRWGGDRNLLNNSLLPYCYCYIVQHMLEHPVGSQRGSWGTTWAPAGGV